MDNKKFSDAVDQLGDLYELAKDQMLRLEVSPALANDQQNLFFTIQRMRDLAATTMQECNVLTNRLESNQSVGVALINQEYNRVVNEKQLTPEHDQQYVRGELPEAAISYLLSGTFDDGPNMPSNWPFDSATFKPTPGDRLRELSKAGAFIVSEINRIAFSNELNKQLQSTN